MKKSVCYNLKLFVFVNVFEKRVSIQVCIYIPIYVSYLNYLGCEKDCVSIFWFFDSLRGFFFLLTPTLILITTEFNSDTNYMELESDILSLRAPSHKTASCLRCWKYRHENSDWLSFGDFHNYLLGFDDKKYFTPIYWFIVKDTTEEPNEGVYRPKLERIPSTGIFIALKLGCAMLLTFEWIWQTLWIPALGVFIKVSLYSVIN